jgi:hypothetical protein
VSTLQCSMRRNDFRVRTDFLGEDLHHLRNTTKSGHSSSRRQRHFQLYRECKPPNQKKTQPSKKRTTTHRLND